MFPSDYPRSLILVELKSKTLAARLLTGLTKVAEDEARKFLGRPQVRFQFRKLLDLQDPDPYLFVRIRILPSTSRKN